MSATLPDTTRGPQTAYDARVGCPRARPAHRHPPHRRRRQGRLGVARFWAAVLGWEVDDESDAEEALAAPPAGGGPGLLFIRVPEPKTGKNRLHLDLQPQDLNRDQEVDRLLALGARVVDDRRQPDGTGWAVLADPEGSEFCVERGRAGR